MDLEETGCEDVEWIEGFICLKIGYSVRQL
jgi:hypothetical protein